MVGWVEWDKVIMRKWLELQWLGSKWICNKTNEETLEGENWL